MSNQTVTEREVRLIQSYLKGLGYQLEITGRYDRATTKVYTDWCHAEGIKYNLLPQYVSEIPEKMREGLLPEINYSAVRSAEAGQPGPATDSGDDGDEDDNVDDGDDGDDQESESEPVSAAPVAATENETKADAEVSAVAPAATEQEAQTATAEVVVAAAAAAEKVEEKPAQKQASKSSSQSEKKGSK